MTAMRFDLRMSFDILMSFDLLRSSGSSGFCCACQIARHAPPEALAKYQREYLENHQWLLSFNTARSKIIKSRDMCCTRNNDTTAPLTSVAAVSHSECYLRSTKFNIHAECKTWRANTSPDSGEPPQ